MKRPDPLRRGGEAVSAAVLSSYCCRPLPCCQVCSGSLAAKRRREGGAEGNWQPEPATTRGQSTGGGPEFHSRRVPGTSGVGQPMPRCARMETPRGRVGRGSISSLPWCAELSLRRWQGPGGTGEDVLTSSWRDWERPRGLCGLRAPWGSTEESTGPRERLLPRVGSRGQSGSDPRAHAWAYHAHFLD